MAAVSRTDAAGFRMLLFWILAAVTWPLSTTIAGACIAGGVVSMVQVFIYERRGE
jgi:hypothetical protein